MIKPKPLSNAEHIAVIHEFNQLYATHVQHVKMDVKYGALTAKHLDKLGRLALDAAEKLKLAH